MENRPSDPNPQEGPSEIHGDPCWVSSASSTDEDAPLIFRRTRRTRRLSDTTHLPSLQTNRPSLKTTLPSLKRVKTSAQTQVPRKPRTRSAGPAIPMTLPAEKTSPLKPKAKPSRPSLKTPSGSVPDASSKRPSLKRPVFDTRPAESDSPKRPSLKKSKPNVPSCAYYEHFLQKTVVRGKVVRPGYFRDQGLELFLDKLEKQGWLELFSDGTVGCSVPELAEFYANCAVTDGVVTSTVRDKEISFDAEDLGNMLGVPTAGYGIYVREAKSSLSREQTLELCRKFAQQPDLDIPRPVLKSEMRSMHRLLYWFIIKNVIPRGQGRNRADIMDLVLVDLMDTGSQINLPALMISHISRIANTAKDHDLGYGFLLSLVFEKKGVILQKRVSAQVNDEIGTRTLIGCGFIVNRGGSGRVEQPQDTVPPVTLPCISSSSPTPSLSSLLADLQKLQHDVSTLKDAVATEQALNAQRHESLLKAIAELASNLSSSQP